MIPQSLLVPSAIIVAIYTIVNAITVVVAIVVVAIFNTMLRPSLPSNPRLQPTSHYRPSSTATRITHKPSPSSIVATPFSPPCHYPATIFLPSSSSLVTCRWPHNVAFLPTHAQQRRRYFPLPKPTYTEPPIVGPSPLPPSSSASRSLDRPHLLLVRAKKGPLTQFLSPRLSPCRCPLLPPLPQPLLLLSALASTSTTLLFHLLVVVAFCTLFNLCLLPLPPLPSLPSSSSIASVAAPSSTAATALNLFLSPLLPLPSLPL
ncbi:hypothetical protein GW17_00039992 [Ensete ventricosum]|nr:hypothetical protein GW17_00039992 [Ensete ventricosum]